MIEQQQQPRGRNPQAIFENQGKASDQPTAAQAAMPRAHTEVVSATGDLITDDPNTIVEAVVRPNHNYGGTPAGMVVRLPYSEFEGNQAALCSKAEYALITARAASPQNQALQRQLAEMRAATSDAFRRTLTQERRAALEQAQAQARADDSKDVRLRQEMAQAAAPPAPAAPVTLAETPATVEELETLIASRRAATEQAKRGANPRTCARLDSLFAEEELELRRDFLAAQEQRAVAAARAQQQAEMAAPQIVIAQPGPPAPAGAPTFQETGATGSYNAREGHAPTVEERLQKLAALYEKGLLTAEVYQQRQAQIAEEV